MKPNQVLKAIALLGLMIVANADRSLLKSSTKIGGSTQAILFQHSDFYSGNTNTANTFITNGNGSWTYTYYASPKSNGNNAGQGNAYYFTPGIGQWQADENDWNYCGSTCNYPASAKESYVYTKHSGVISVAFPSKSLGVFVTSSYGAEVRPAGNGEIAQIFFSIDQGTTWSMVSGVPVVTDVEASGDLSATPPTAVYPAFEAGDLAAVKMASKTLGWAVGGNGIVYGMESWDAASGQGKSTGSVPVGVLYMAAGGVTTWKFVPLFYTAAEANAVVAGGNMAAIKALYSKPVPGILFAVDCDSAGKNVWIGGTPYSTITDFTSSPTTYDIATVPTIMYSGNAGTNWVMQSAPVMAGISYAVYGLAVKSGTTVYAVGGSTTGLGPSGSPWTTACPTGWAGTGGCAGTIIGTTNGGFSWSWLNYPGVSTATAPLFSSIALNGNMVWVGTFTRQDEYYPTPVNGTTAGTSLPVLLSMDGKTFVSAATYSTFPAGFAKSATTVPLTTNTDVMGIVWDNAMRGYIYGYPFVIATSDGGKTWVYETPNDIITAANDDLKTVNALAIMPTTY